MSDGDKGREGERANGTAATDHTAGRRSGGQAEGRQEGREERGTRMALRLESGGGDHGSRQGAGRERKKEIYKYLRERREKNAAETRKSIQVCVYTYHLIPWRVGCLLHFLLYI